MGTVWVCLSQAPPTAPLFVYPEPGERPRAWPLLAPEASVRRSVRLTACRWSASCRDDWHSSKSRAAQTHPRSPPFPMTLVCIPAATQLVQRSVACARLAPEFKGRSKHLAVWKTQGREKGLVGLGCGILFFSFPWLPSAVGSLGVGICY